MKSNIMIIVLVTLVALVVIITVIIASVMNNSESQPSDSSDSPSYSAPADYGSSGYSSPNSGSDPQSDSQSGSDSGHNIGEDIVNTARSILEREEKVPFLENGAGLDGFDNSGFIYYVLLENGFITCPRLLNAQAKMGRRLEFDELKPGDLVFFCNDGNTERAGFGGIYTGNGTMIACLRPGTFVDEIDISGKHYREIFYCGVSLS